LSTTTFEGRLAEARHRIDAAAERLAQLQARIDRTEDWATVASAVEAELRRWDSDLERLQTSVAIEMRDAREQAEAAIAELRSRRIVAGERFAAARDDLRRQTDELSASCE
jgi:chromosome segregation ATPase